MRRLSSFGIFALLLALVFSFSVSGYGQTFRGAINGTVTDPSGAVVAGASVKATNTATGIVLTSVTTSDGQFAFQDLPLGTYRIEVSASGFSTVVVAQVPVTAGSVYTVPVRLKLGQQATAIEVSAAALSVDTTTATQSATIPGDVVQNIPLNGRDFTQLIQTAPGYGGYSGGGFGSLNGTRPNQINWQIDGVDNNDFWHNVPAVNQGGVSGIAGIILPIDSVDEFSAQTQNGPEAGRNAGGTVNLVIKSGTNSWHGSVYHYNRNEFYSAASPFFIPSSTVPKSPPLRNLHYGFSAGGPIIKNKTFFFVGFEKQQYLIGLSGLATEPSDQWVANANQLLISNGITQISTTSCHLLGPLTSSLPASSLPGGTPCTNPGLWPTSGPGSIAGLQAIIHNFFSPVASTGYSYNGIAKVDHNFSDRHRFSFRWFGGQGSQTAPLGGSPALGTASSNLKYYFEVAPLHVYNYSAVLNSAFSSRVSNQVLVGVNYFNQVFHDFNNSFDTKALGLFLSPDATIKGQPIPGAPNIKISGFEQVGLTPPEGRNDITGHLTDIISYNTGPHQLRFGGEFRQARVNEFYHRRGTGTFVFDGTFGPAGTGWAPGTDPTTAALADFLAGNVSSCAVPPGAPAKSQCGSTIAVGNPERFVRVNAFNLYFQDSWQATRRLNLNFGMRYEYFGPLHSDKKDLGVFIPEKGLLVQGVNLDSVFPADRNNFAPRIGFAFQPKEGGDLVVRGGIGVFYDQINMNPFLDFRPPITAAQGLQGNPIGASPVSTYSREAYNWDTAQTGGASIFPGVVACSDPLCTSNPGFNVFGVSQNFRTPYFYNYNLQVEKGLGNAAVFQIGYVGSEGRKLNLVSNINQITAAHPNPSFPNFGSILQLNSTGISNYNSLQSTLRLRLWHGLTSQFAYTWAHSLDEISEYRAVILDDAFNPKLDYGNSDYDTRHLFTANIAYDVPKASWAPGWSKWILDNWQVSSLWVFHSGQPSDEVRLGLDVVGDPFAGVSHKFSAANGGTQWWNPAAFAVSASEFGNLSRNRFVGPGYGTVDLSVIKNIPVTERVKIRLQADIFNLLNRINLSQGPGAVGSTCAPNPLAANPLQCTTKGGFGLVSDTAGDFFGAPGIGAGEAFNMQLAVKITF
jgi:Carboxypeptidase regulatory-like domain/TonB dependent receptor